MLFTREELVEMGLLKPELSSDPLQLESVATSRLPDCQQVVGVKQQVATDLTPYISYIYISRLLGCKNILEVEGEYNKKYRVQTHISPVNPSNLPDVEIFVSLWNTYGCADFMPVATSDNLRQPDQVQRWVDKIRSTHIYALIHQDWAFYKRFGHLPGDAWDGIITDDGLTLDTFDAKLSRVWTDAEVLSAAQIERQRVRPGRTMLSLMYEHNVKNWTWFEGHDGQWHCFNNEGLE